MDDEALMRRFQAGDQDAFAILVQRWHGQAIRFCRQMVRDEDIAEDLAQEAFARMLLRPQGWGGQANFTTYLFSILKNLCIDELRWQGRWQNSPPTQQETPDPGPTPEEALVKQLERQRIADLLAQLNPDYRAALILREYHEYSYAEISEIMGWSEAKTKVTIYRARLALGRQLTREEGGHDRVTC